MTTEASRVTVYACVCGCGRSWVHLCDERGVSLAMVKMEMDHTISLCNMLADIIEAHDAKLDTIGEVAGHA
jgi:hypothetical protein